MSEIEFRPAMTVRARRDYSYAGNEHVLTKGKHYIVCGTCGPYVKVLGDSNRGVEILSSFFDVVTDEWDAMKGASPNATGGVPSEDFVRALRDEW